MMNSLSVVVTIVDGGPALQRCLAALTTQAGAPPFEVVVPHDRSVAGIPVLAAQFPGCRFLDLGDVATERPAGSAAGQHELFDRRRAAGLAAAGGDIVAIVEDRAPPRSDWAASLLAEHTRHPHAVIGGAVANGRDVALHRAVFLSDYGRYEPPFEAGPRDWVTDVNVSYKRPSLEAVRAVWADAYHETSVHWALQRAGATLWLTPAFVVESRRDELTMGGLLGERFAWGRLFAATRARESGLGRRLVRAAAAPVLPLVLLLRIARREIARRRGAKLPAIVPALILLLTAWSLGEATGEITGKP